MESDETDSSNPVPEEIDANFSGGSVDSGWVPSGRLDSGKLDSGRLDSDRPDATRFDSGPNDSCGADGSGRDEAEVELSWPEPKPEMELAELADLLSEDKRGYILVALFSQANETAKAGRRSPKLASTLPLKLEVDVSVTGASGS